MTHIDTVKAVWGLLLLTLLLPASTPQLWAQSGFVLSKHADFSTDDRAFDRTDILYMLVTAPQIDFNDLKKNELRLKPDDGGNDIRGVFTNHFDGTYTASLDLSLTDPDEDEWEWRAKIEDDDGNAFEARVTLQIGEDHDDEGEDDEGQDDDGEDDDEDEEDEEGEDEVEFTGVIDALDAGSITVDGVLFLVDAQTVVLDDDNTPIAFGDLVVGLLVEIRGERGTDGVLVATRIKIEDEDDAPDATGRLGALEKDRITVEERTFLIDDGTQVLDAHDTPMPLSDLEVGQTVAVHARNAAASLPVAARVKVLGAGDVAAAAESAEGVPGRFLLEQNYPNPFNPKTTIAFEIGQEATTEPVSLVVYNMLGEAVQTLVQGRLGVGRYEYVWEGRNGRGHPVATGVYLYRLRVGRQVQTRTMILLK